MNIYISLFLAIFSFVFLWLKNRRNYWSSRGFLSSKLTLPFGSLKGIGSEKAFSIGLDEFYKEFKGKGPAVGLFYFTKPLLMPISLELIKSILVTDFKCFQDRSVYYNKEDDPISAHLFALEGKNSFKLIPGSFL